MAGSYGGVEWAKSQDRSAESDRVCSCCAHRAAGVRITFRPELEREFPGLAEKIQRVHVAKILAGCLQQFDGSVSG